MTKEEKKIYNVAWREMNPDYQANYYQSHKEEKIAYWAAHREERRAHNATYNAGHREEAAAYYQENRDALLEKKRQDFAEFTEWLQNLRTVNGCADCSIHEGLLLHHHEDPATKRYNVSSMYTCSHDVLQAELAKCIVLCGSCHQKRHVEMKAPAA